MEDALNVSELIEDAFYKFEALVKCLDSLFKLNLVRAETLSERLVSEAAKFSVDTMKIYGADRMPISIQTVEGTFKLN